MTLQQAIYLLSFPRVLGKAVNETADIKLGIGRFGPYVVCDGDFRSIPKGESIFAVTLQRAHELFAIPKKGRGRAAPLKDLGPHPESGDPVHLMNGPYGIYIKSGKVNASLPEGDTIDTITMAKAVELLAAKAGTKSAGKKAKKPTAEKQTKAAPAAKAAAKTPVKVKTAAKAAQGSVAKASDKSTVAKKGGDKKAKKKAAS